MHLSTRFDLSAPWTVIFGPSGSGKSTILRALGGLVAEATVSFDRTTVDAPDVWMPLAGLASHCRSLAYAPQHAALFPHLSVAENVSFPYEVCAEPPGDSSLVDEAMSLFSLHALADRMPGQLSGGERRRVSLARAFATPHARLMLLDEPFAGLDRALRDELLPAMQRELAKRKLPVLSVTHDVDEALLLNAEVIRLEAGNVTAQGLARVVLAEERSRLLTVLGASASLGVIGEA
jgi:molybdate transport system ATP-binding protein